MTTTAQDARQRIQSVLGTSIDGRIGKNDRAAFDALAAAPADSEWPPRVVAAAEPSWLTIARAELGTAEIAGSRDNPRIVEYHSATTLRATDDETPWCSSFVNWCLKKAGKTGTGNAMARSFLSGWGDTMAAPRPGCIVVFERGAYPKGHVAFFLSGGVGTVNVLGGNQGNKVSIATFPARSVIGYRWPL